MKIIIEKINEKKNIYAIFILCLIVLIALIIFFMINFNQQGEAVIQWSDNAEKNVSGYKIYYSDKKRTSDSPPGGYENSIDVGRTTSAKIDKLDDGKTYYFSITAYNKFGLESPFSEEKMKEIKIPFFKKIENAFIQLF